jgi:hypothetical protein
LNGLNGRIVWLSGEKLEDLFEEEERSEGELSVKEVFGEEFFAEKLFGKERLERTKFSEKNISV